MPALKRRRSAGTPQAAEKLAEAIARRMPERSLLSIVARTAYWLGWHHHFGPASGSDPKISDPLGRYCMAVFTGGVNIGPYEAARHIAGVSARELSMVRNRHIDLKKLNAAIATVVNAFAELDVVRAWGDGTAVAADGTQVETYIDNLLAETSIRYGGVGGIAYHYVSDTYVALFSRFIPCGVWEAVHLIEGLLANSSDIQPSTVHADTQGQSAPVFTLATLFGFDLMPRIRNFRDLIFFRASEHLVYAHIDELFGERGRNVIDWKLIERHWQDLMQVAISISEGRLSLGHADAAAAVQLPQEPHLQGLPRGRPQRPDGGAAALPRRPSAAGAHHRRTNKVGVHGFAHWLSFGNNGVLADNDPAEQEKLIKLNTCWPTWSSSTTPGHHGRGARGRVPLPIMAARPARIASDQAVKLAARASRAHGWSSDSSLHRLPSGQPQAPCCCRAASTRRRAMHGGRRGCQAWPGTVHGRPGGRRSGTR